MNRNTFFHLLPHTDDLQSVIVYKEDTMHWEDGRFSDAALASVMEAKGTASLHQVHGKHVIIARDPIDRTQQADGMITDQKGLLLITRWADCQNFLVYAPDKNVVGVLHAGWKGLNAGIIPEFFRVLQEEWKVDPEDTIVCGGPSLCLQHAQFSNPPQELPNVDPQHFHGRHIDLCKIAMEQFAHAGVPIDQFERDPDCTCCIPGSYWTYRGGDRAAVERGCSNALACMLV